MIYRDIWCNILTTGGAGMGPLQERIDRQEGSSWRFWLEHPTGSNQEYKIKIAAKKKNRQSH